MKRVEACINDGLGLHMETKRQATVVTLAGKVEVARKGNWLWRTKSVKYTPEGSTNAITGKTKLPATNRRAIRFAAKLTPDQTDFAAYAEDGSAHLYVPVNTKDKVEIKNWVFGGSRRSVLFRPEIGKNANTRLARAGTILTDTIDVEGRGAKLTAAWDEVKENLRKVKGTVVLRKA